MENKAENMGHARLSRFLTAVHRYSVSFEMVWICSEYMIIHLACLQQCDKKKKVGTGTEKLRNAKMLKF